MRKNISRLALISQPDNILDVTFNDSSIDKQVYHLKLDSLISCKLFEAKRKIRLIRKESSGLIG